jgi:hypothetical protein
MKKLLAFVDKETKYRDGFELAVLVALFLISLTGVSPNVL